ncbi:MAG: hypothetical protein J7M17_07375 [Anaerolineae bacterium]|nr:hypothetical protein [Anaerolineae bacterium]
MNTLKKQIEAALIIVAAKILMNRSHVRANVTSRGDNNTMWYMAEKLDSIAAHIRDGYVDEEDDPDPMNALRELLTMLIDSARHGDLTGHLRAWQLVTTGKVTPDTTAAGCLDTLALRHRQVQVTAPTSQ